MNALIQHYNWSPKGEIIESQHGTTDYLGYLEKEKARIEKRPGRVAEIQVAGDRCALFVNDIRDGRYRGKSMNGR